MERLAASTGWKSTRNPVDDVAYTHASQVESCHADDGVSDLLSQCDDVSLLCVQRQTKTIHRRAASGGLRKTLRQKTASSNENPGGILGDRDRNNELTRWRTL